MTARESVALRRLHLLLDLCTIVAAMFGAAWLHTTLRAWLPVLRAIPTFGEYAILGYLTVPLWLGLIAVLELHRTFEEPWSHGVLLTRLIKLHAAGFVGLASLQFFTQSIINRSLVALFLACSFLGMYGVRAALAAWVRYQHRHGVGRLRVILVGNPGARMGNFVRDARAHAYPPAILGYLRVVGEEQAASLPPPDITSIACIGSLNELRQILHQQAVDQVMFFPPANHPERAREALATCEELGVPASFAVSLTQLARSTPRITSAYQHPFVTFELAPKRAEWLALKHLLDTVLAGLLIVLLSPVLLAVALAILITMGRPILFVQERAGLYGRTFRMFKFRSMVQGAEAMRETLESQNELDGPAFKLKEDPRVTRLGRFLRRTSLDELPQLFNVLTGSMSLVGPRPLPVFEQQRISGWQRRRLSMKPGITGLWQVSGRSGLDFEEWMLLDLKYIDEWSLTLDFVLLLRTVPAVLFGRGAY